MKFLVTSKSISVLAFSRPILIYITNNNVVNIIIIVRKSFLRFFAV